MEVTSAMAAASASTSALQLRGFCCTLVQVRVQGAAVRSIRPLGLFSRKTVNVLAFKTLGRDLKRVGFCLPSSSTPFQMTATAVRPQLLRGERQRMTFTTKALPADTYWITVFQAVGVSVLMALTAVISGIAINIGIEIKAIKEFAELERKGEFKEEDYQLVPDEDFGSFENEEALYILTNKEPSGNRTTRNRPVRELQEAELQEMPSDQ